MPTCCRSISTLHSILQCQHTAPHSLQIRAPVISPVIQHGLSHLLCTLLVAWQDASYSTSSDETPFTPLCRLTYLLIRSPLLHNRSPFTPHSIRRRPNPPISPLP